MTTNLWWFEDFTVGDEFDLGSATVTADEIVTFAELYDPQEFHLGTQMSRQTIFDGLIASGWQTAAVWNRMFVEAVLVRTAATGSPGGSGLRWLAPVRADELLTGSATVISARASASRPQLGVLEFDGALTVQGNRVFDWQFTLFVTSAPQVPVEAGDRTVTGPVPKRDGGDR